MQQDVQLQQKDHTEPPETDFKGIRAHPAGTGHTGGIFLNRRLLSLCGIAPQSGNRKHRLFFVTSFQWKVPGCLQYIPPHRIRCSGGWSRAG